MARILLIAKSIGRKGRTEGDPSVVVENSHIFGERADKSRWIASGNDPRDFPGIHYVVDIPDMPLAIAERIMQVWKRPATIVDLEWEGDVDDRYVWIGRHRWQLGVADRLPGPIKAALRRDGIIELPYDEAAINSYMIDRNSLDTFIPGPGGPIDP